MKIMTGIDLHSNNALCGLTDESGRRALHKKLPCDLPSILQVLAPCKECIAQVAVESTYNWYWLLVSLQPPATEAESLEEFMVIRPSRESTQGWTRRPGRREPPFASTE